MKFVFIADFFVDQVLGGGEINNEEFINILREKGHEIHAVNSQLVTLRLLSEYKDYNFIVANFVRLSEETKRYLLDKKYVIYEHDHKYLTTRNPSDFENYLAPKEAIINYDFYKSAISVFCQTSFHKNIVEKNLNLDNIVSLGGNLWPTEYLDSLEEMSKVEKTDTCAIINSPVPHKNTSEAVLYCNAMNIDYKLIDFKDPIGFLKELGTHKALVFFPKTPETLSRVVVEARMMGMGTKTTQNIGALHEPWFSKKGSELVELMRNKREEIPEIVVSCFGG